MTVRSPAGTPASRNTPSRSVVAATSVPATDTVAAGTGLPLGPVTRARLLGAAVGRARVPRASAHADGRIAKWSEEDFFKAIRTQKRPDGSTINPVMPKAFGDLNDVELKAIWVFLKTLPAAATGVR